MLTTCISIQVFHWFALNTILERITRIYKKQRTVAVFESKVTFLALPFQWNLLTNAI